MQFSPAHFDRHIANIGQEIQWRRSYACSCVSPTTGAPDPKHSVCAGKGRIWDAPLKLVAGVPSQNTYSKMIAAGLWEQGDMALVIPQSHKMWEFAGRLDRVTMLNSTDVFSLPLVRGSPTERLLFKPQKIDRVFWFDQQTGQLIEGGKPVIDLNGIISWTDVSNPPPPAEKYSITGTRYSEYFIYDHFPSDRNQHSGKRLPKRLQLRKWDMFGR